MAAILTSENRRVATLKETRRRDHESNLDYRSRLSTALAASGAEIAWLCVPPGPHVLTLLEACADAGVHAVAEKPWFGSPAETQSIRTLAQENGIKVGVHYEYCMLDEIQSWRSTLSNGSGLSFNGKFQHSRPNHLGISALDNLGSHLLSIHSYALPESHVSQLVCAYEMPDERRVWVEKGGKPIVSLDLLSNTQPIVQRFIAKFEAALEGAAWELDLNFALRVATQVAALKK
jgi:predicted dehydrogenase